MIRSENTAWAALSASVTSPARAKCQRTRFTQEVLRQEGDQGVSRKSQMSGRSGLCNVVSLRGIFNLRKNSLSSKAPDAGSRRLVRHLCSDVGGGLRRASSGAPLSPLPAHRQLHAALSCRPVRRFRAHLCRSHARTPVYGGDSCRLVLQHLHWRRGTRELHVGT